VDITNYVMLELGQPLHAFDLEKIDGSKKKTIVVRTAKEGEKISLIDGTEKKLGAGMLVIADTKKPVALAGVMGGKNSEIGNQTTKIILESANFDFINIRKTSTILGLRTEASMRFEKGLDPNLAEMGLKKALALITEIIPEAKVGSKIVDVKNFKLNPASIKFDTDYLNNKIGTAVPIRRAMDILLGLGFGVKSAGKTLTVKIPTWRATKDIAIAEDLVEEVVRIYGYENISPLMPKASIAPPEVNKSRMVEKIVKNILAGGLEMTEVYNYSFVDEKVLRQAGFDPAKHIRLKNSIAKNLSHLRQSLVPNLILNISQNQHFFDKIRVFEMGTIFYPEAGEYKKDSRGKEMIPQQDKSLVGMVLEKGNDTPFYETKDALAALLSAMNLDCQFSVWKSEAPPWAHPARTLQVNARGKTIGVITELNPNIQKNFGIKHRVGLFGINFDELANLYSDSVIYRAIPKYPAIEFDLAVIVPRKTVWAEVSKAIFEVENNLVKEVRLFDVFEGRGMEEGKKSLAFRIVYRSDSRTLKLEEAKKIEEKIIQKLNQKFGAKLRA
jgi:phenylalanyl-tRNA synthetase beta chain